MGTISTLSEGGRKPKGITTRHWLWRVKDIPHAAWSRSRTHSIALRGECVTTVQPSLSSQESNQGRRGERRTCYHGATKGKGSDNFGIFFDGFWTNSGNVLLLRLDISIIRTTREQTSPHVTIAQLFLAFARLLYILNRTFYHLYFGL